MRRFEIGVGFRYALPDLRSYCSLGNQPHMELKQSGGNTLEFVLSDKNPGIASLLETHMHAVAIAFDSKDSITSTWTLYDKGAKQNDVVVKLSRTKP